MALKFTLLVVLILLLYARGGGGGQKTEWKTPSPNFVELIENITNMLFFFSGVSREKSYEVTKLGGRVLAKKIFGKKFITFLNFFLAL